MLMRRPVRRARAAAAAFTLVALLASACGGAPAEPRAASDHGPAPEFDQKLASEGKTVANANGCIACHTTDGKTSVGPTWKGLFGHDVALADGSTVKADEAYLRESIVDPQAKVVKGYGATIMPATIGRSLSDGQVKSVVEYIKSLH